MASGRQLWLFAEGQTEQAFGLRILGPHLDNFGIWLPKPILFATSRDKRKGKIYKGGVLSYAKVEKDIKGVLDNMKDPLTSFTTMIDLYCLPRDFPGWDEAKALRPTERIRMLEGRFGDRIGDPRFIPHIQLHEFEAILFANPDKFSPSFEDREKSIRHLQEIAAGYASPEEIDDGPETAPSKRILKLIPEYEKVTAGVDIAQRIGLAVIREKCPHFGEWLTRLERLAEEENPSPRAEAD